MAQDTPQLSSPFKKQEEQENSGAKSPQLGGELLQALTFQPTNKRLEIARPDEPLDRSELGVRESIPIALGSEVSSPGWNDSAPKRPEHHARLSIGSQTWRIQPLDATGTISYLDEDVEESPVNPFANRQTLSPDDSISMAFYHQRGQQPPSWGPKTPDEPEQGTFTLDSEAYSVINKILNVYHESDTITPQIAQECWEQVQSVSPIVAQHRDWSSKEATETYLARLLSDAAAAEREAPRDSEATPVKPAQHATTTGPSIRQLEADPEESFGGGTAIIFQSESRRYSRGSRASVTSAATTIEGPSRPDSSSDPFARDRHRDRDSEHGNGLYSAAHAPVRETRSPLSHEVPLQLLPDIVGTGEGLGLSVQQQQQQQQQGLEQQQQQHPLHALENAPPKPPYSPPPPPTLGAVTSRLHADDAPPASALDDRHVPSSIPSPSPNLIEPFRMSDFGISASATGGYTASELGVDAQGTPMAKPDDFAPAAGSDNTDEERAKAIQQVQKRYRVIEELCKTEHSFCVDMMVAHQIFEGTSKEILTEEERKLLFSNCKDLENFSHNLWKSLKDAIRPIVNQTPPDEASDKPYDEFVHCTPENDVQVRVGEVMLAFAPRMERVYTTYYLNYDEASKFIKANEQNPELLGWVMACFQHCPNLTTAWNLESLLIKPVQRLLRYPLLLKELIAKTVPDHPDMPTLQQATDAISAIATRIDGAKKRQETLRAATSEGKKQKGKGAGERNVKSIVKALRWSKEKAKTLQEAALIFEDQEYNQVTQKFGGHFFQIQIVISDMETYLQALTESTVQLNSVMLGFITVSETGVSANPEMESTWRRWAMAHLDLQNKSLEEHVSHVVRWSSERS